MRTAKVSTGLRIQSDQRLHLLPVDSLMSGGPPPEQQTSGHSVSKLTMSLVNVCLKLCSFNIAYILIFLLTKYE